MPKRCCRNEVNTAIVEFEVVSPLGWGKEETWQKLAQPTSTKPDKLSIEASEVDVVDFLFNSISDSLKEHKPDRIACVVSNSKYNFNLSGFSDNSNSVRYPDQRGGIYSSIYKLLPNYLSIYLAQKVGRECFSLAYTAACATGLLNVIKGIELIQRGVVDCVIAGSIETSKNEFIETAFSRMGVISASECIRPFSADRDGFLIGEGGALFVLRKTSNTSHKHHGFVTGYDYCNDAFHPLKFEPSGEVIKNSIQRSYSMADINAVDYINAHGTSTSTNDKIESIVLANLVKEGKTKVSSTKPYTGHLLGAAGSVELALSLIAMKKNFYIPNLNCTQPILAGLVLDNSISNELNSFLTLNYGFGGHVASLVVRGKG